MPDNLEPPKVAVVQTEFSSDRTTRVQSVTLDSSGLSILVSSQRWDARVAFEQTYGFRVLDELDLTEFWPHCTLKDGWLFQVTSGGWKDLELTCHSCGPLGTTQSHINEPVPPNPMLNRTAEMLRISVPFGSGSRLASR